MLSKLSVKKPFTVVVAVILVLILGAVSYLNMGVDLLPEMELPYVVVSTAYPGASPDQVDQELTRPLESALASVSGLETLSSVSNENFSMVILQFSTSMNMDSAMIELSSAVDTVSSSLPEGASAPILMRINPSMLPVMMMTADKSGLSEAEFTTYAQEELQPALERIEGVASVSLMGAVTERVEITWKQKAIDELNQRILDSIDSELADAQRDLDDARAEIKKGKAELEEKSADAYEDLAKVSGQLADGRLQLQLGMNTLEQTPAELEAQKQELLSTKESLESFSELLAAREELEDGLAQMEEGLEQIEAAEEMLDESYEQLYEQKQDLKLAIAAYGANANATTTGNLIEEMVSTGQLLAKLAAMMEEMGVSMGDMGSLGGSLGDLLPGGSLPEGGLEGLLPGGSLPGGSLPGGSMEDASLESLLAALNPETLTALFAAHSQAALGLAEQLVTALDLAVDGLDDARKSLAEQKEELESAYSQMLQYKSQMDSAMAQAGDMDEEDLAEAIDQIDEGVYQIDKALAELPSAKYELEDAKDELEEGQTELEKGKMELSTQLSTAAVQLAMGEAQLDTAYEQFEEAREEAFRNAGLDGVLTTDMLSGILAASNFSMPAGYLGGDDADTLVKVGNKFASLDELKNLLLMDLDVAEIGAVYLYDVAEIELVNDAGESYTRVNGNPGLIVSISKQSMYSTNDVSKSINEKMEELMTADPDLHLVALSDQGYYIRMAVSAVADNLILGGILAVLVLLLFLRSIRPTVVIAISIPISLLGALALMYFTGVNINVISLAGLAAGVGMLVDNSIVTIENISRLRSLGVPPATAAVQGAKQIAGAIVSSTLTTVCVFLPIVFTQGLARQLFVDMGLTVAYSLLASLLVALSLVPMMASKTLTKPMKPETKGFSRFVKGYGKLLRWCLGHKWPVFLLVLGLMALALLGAGLAGTELIPAVDYGQVSVSITAPEGVEMTEEELQEHTDTLLNRVLELDNIVMVGAFEGSGDTMGMMSSGGGSDYQLSLYVICDYEAGLSGAEASRQIRELSADLPVECSVDNAGMDMSAMLGSGIQVQLFGEDEDTLRELTGEVSQLLADVEGIGEIQDGLDIDAPELRVIVDKNAAMRQGLTVAQVYSELASALRQETEAMTLSLVEEEYPVIIVNAAEDTLSAADIKDYQFTVESQTMEGETEEKTFRLNTIAKIQEGQGLASVNRVDQQRYHSIDLSLADGYNVGLVSRDVETRLKDLELPPGYKLEMAGENESINESMGDLLLMIVLAILFIYLIMVAQFQSLLLPFIVLTTIPLAFTGGLLALLLGGHEISIIAMLGFLLLAGIIVNNGIVFIDCVNQLRLNEGMEKREALVAAGKMRMRPILMTALTTIFGLAPMAFSQQMGAELLQSLALVTVGGLVYATVLTMFFVPLCYDLLQRRPLKQVEILEGEEEELLKQAQEQQKKQEEQEEQKKKPEEAEK